MIDKGEIKNIYIDLYSFKISTLIDIARYLYKSYEKDIEKNKFGILILFEDSSQKFSGNIDALEELKDQQIKSFWMYLNISENNGMVDVKLNESALFPSDSSIRISSGNIEWTAGRYSEIFDKIKSSVNHRGFLYKSRFAYYLQNILGFLFTAFTSFYLLAIINKLFVVPRDFQVIYFILLLIVNNFIIYNLFFYPATSLLKSAYPNVEMFYEKQKHEKSLPLIYFSISWNFLFPIIIMILSLLFGRQ